MNKANNTSSEQLQNLLYFNSLKNHHEDNSLLNSNEILLPTLQHSSNLGYYQNIHPSEINEFHQAYNTINDDNGMGANSYSILQDRSHEIIHDQIQKKKEVQRKGKWTVYSHYIHLIIS